MPLHLQRGRHQRRQTLVLVHLRHLAVHTDQRIQFLGLEQTLQETQFMFCRQAVGFFQRGHEFRQRCRAYFHRKTIRKNTQLE